MAAKDNAVGIRSGKTLNLAVRSGLTSALVVIGFLIIYFCYTASYLGVATQWLAALFFLVLIGILIKVINSLNGLGTTGIYLIGTKHGIKFIDAISKKYRRFWNAMAIWGIVVGFGLISYPLLKGKIDKRLYAFGIISLMAIAYIAVPSTIYGLQFINLPQIQSALSSAQAAPAQSGISLIEVVVYLVALVFGFSGYIIFLLAVNAATVIAGIYNFIGTVISGVPQSSILKNQVPGVAPLIPGIDVPLFQTIIALAIILVIHEFSHGILARIEKVKLKQIGLVIFGVIPIGAFVEPDEKAVLKLNSHKQSKIMAAGISSNLIAAIFFMVVMYLMIAFIVPGLYSNQVFVASTTPGFPAYNSLQPGMQILYWNGYKIENLSSFTVAAANDIPNRTVTVITNTGQYSYKAVAIGNSTKGYIGITTTEPLSSSPFAQAAYFLYTVVVLTFMLNLFVGIVNLLPVPGFDGWRLYKANIKNGKLVNLLAAFVVIVILINVLPLFFYLA
jgi:membrane-associated protease RseP (regulator of RpoE activity)